MLTALLVFLRVVLKLLGYALTAFLLLILLSFVSPYVKEIQNYHYLSAALSFEHKVVAEVGNVLRKFIPTSIRGFDLTPFFVIFVLFILISQVHSLSARLKFRAEFTYDRYQEEFEKIKKVTHLDEHNKDVAELKHDLEELKHVHGKKRKDLILHFMEVKGRLEAYEHVLAFLSIDVVGSTAMKKAENAMVISADFYRYNEMADKVLKANNVIKVATTPDGIMAAFKDTDHAVNAAQQLINELDHFNKFVKKMKSDFQIRCGINTGMIYFDIDEPLEHISDRVIDIAGHMQKDAEPNTINIAKSAIAPLDKTGGFTTTEKVIDEQVVYTWRPK
jgi:uncharacterized protein YggT (Ycf19 family)